MITRMGPLLALVVVLSASLVSATSGADGQAATGEPVWTPSAVIAALRATNGRTAAIAEGMLYVLPESTFPEFDAVLAQHPAQNPMPIDKIICRALVLRGYAPAVTACARAISPGVVYNSPYRLTEQELLRETTPEELMPLARALAEVEEPRHLTLAYSGSEAWFTIAGQTGEPHLLQLVLDIVAAPQGVYTKQKLFGRCDPDRCIDLMLPHLREGTSASKLDLIDLLRSGWHSGPPEAATEVLHDRDPLVRIAFLQTLAGSRSPSALAFIREGEGDRDAQVRQVATAVRASSVGIGGVSVPGGGGGTGAGAGTGPGTNAGPGAGSGPDESTADPLRAVAVDPQANGSQRLNAWLRLSRLPGNDLIHDAKSVSTDASAQRSLREVAMSYLATRGETPWLLETLPHLESAQAKADVITALVRSGSTEVFAQMQGFIRQSEPGLARQVVQSLSTSADPRAVPLLITYLEDPRMEIQAMAARTLATLSHLDYVPPFLTTGVPEHSTAAIETACLHDGWVRWYETFGAPLDAQREADVDLVRAEIRKRLPGNHEPLTSTVADMRAVLLRLSADPDQLGRKALSLLTTPPDAVTERALLRVADGPTFWKRQDELVAALTRGAKDEQLVPEVVALLARPLTQRLAVQLLIAWQVDAPALTDAILHPSGFTPDLSGLGAWPDCPVLTMARLHATHRPDDDPLQVNAFWLLTQAGQAQDVPLLSQHVIDAGNEMRESMRCLVRLAMSGVPSASDALAHLLTLPAQPVAAPPARRSPTADIDRAECIITGIAEHVRSDRSARTHLTEPLLAAIRTCLPESPSETRQLAGLALLMTLDDRGGPAVVRSMVSTAPPAQLKRLVDQVVADARPESRPYIDSLLAAPFLNADLPHRLLDWYINVGNLRGPQLAAVETTLRAHRDEQADVPVFGLSAVIIFPADASPLQTAPQPATVHLTNAGTSVFRTQADQLGLYLNVRRMGDADPFCELSVHVDASTLPQPPPGVGGAQLVIAPGTSVSVAVTFDTPGTAYDAVSHQVQLCWRLVFTSVRRGDPPEERTFIASWMNHAFVPSLLDAIDRRHLAPAP